MLRALEKDRERRYETVAELAADLRRFLQDEPVLAGPPSARYRLTKFARRNRGRLIAAGLVAAVALAGGAATAVKAIELARTVDDFDQVSAVLALRRAEEEQREQDFADELPANADRMQRWLEGSARLVDGRPAFEAMLARLPEPANDATAGAPHELGAKAFLREEIVRLVAGLDALAAVRPVVARRLFWAQQVTAATFAFTRSPCTKRRATRWTSRCAFTNAATSRTSTTTARSPP